MTPHGPTTTGVVARPHTIQKHNAKANTKGRTLVKKNAIDFSTIRICHNEEVFFISHDQKNVDRALSLSVSYEHMHRLSARKPIVDHHPYPYRSLPPSQR